MMPEKDIRTNEWFLTINQNAECYNDVYDIINELNYELYGLVTHDKDNIEQPHKHAYIKVKNALTFKSMFNKFKGANIQPVKLTKKSIQYLVHKNDKDKYSYNPNDIISNNLEYIKSVINEEENQWEVFNEFKMLDYIVDGTTNSYLFIKRFGPKQWNTYWKAYNEILTQEALNNNDLMNDLQEIRANRTIEELKQTGLPIEIEETGELINE